MANTFITDIQDTWNNANTDFRSIQVTVNSIASQTTSKFFSFAIGTQNSIYIAGYSNGQIFANAGFFIGNTTANLLANSILVSLANSTATLNLQPTQIKLGSITVNTTAFLSGANLFFDTVKFSVGNTIANLIANSILVSLANATATLNLQPTSIVLGSVTINTTAFLSGANVFLDTGKLSLGNSTVNAVINSVGANYSAISIINSAGAFIGANLFIDVGKLSIGNSTVNSTVNSSQITTTGSLRFGTFTANTTATLTGFLTVQDAGGTTRKIMVFV